MEPPAHSSGWIRSGHRNGSRRFKSDLPKASHEAATVIMIYRLILTISLLTVQLAAQDSVPDCKSDCDSLDQLGLDYAYWFIKGPKLLHKPPTSLPLGVSIQDTARVSVRALVDTLGVPYCLQILKSENESLNEHALSLASQYRFTPFTYKGKKIKCFIMIPFKFAN